MPRASHDKCHSTLKGVWGASINLKNCNTSKWLEKEFWNKIVCPEVITCGWVPGSHPVTPGNRWVTEDGWVCWINRGALRNDLTLASVPCWLTWRGSFCEFHNIIGAKTSPFPPGSPSGSRQTGHVLLSGAKNMTIAAALTQPSLHQCPDIIQDVLKKVDARRNNWCNNS